MRIVYFANHSNTGSDDTERHIYNSLTYLGHEVSRIDEYSPDLIPEGGYDVLLFHKGGPYIFEVLPKIRYKKVFWYFDKVWNDRPQWFKKILPLVDQGFLTDETWLLANPSKKLSILRQGIGDEGGYTGNKKAGKYKGKIAFTGSSYGERVTFCHDMKKRYGEDFQVYNDVFNKDLYDLCATIPIIISPEYPSDDHYWSSRVYMVIGSGGFLIHPWCQDLRREYKVTELPMYETRDQLYEFIDFFLRNELTRERFRKDAFARTHKDYSYLNRCRELTKAIQLPGNTGTRA